jgi:hypothetical protein
MKTKIDNQGVVSNKNGEGLEIYGLDHKQAPFNNLWDDLYAFIDEGAGPAALTYEGYRDTGFFMRFFRHNQTDSIFMKYQMPHEWNGESVYPHMHAIPMASGSGDVVMEYSYAWSIINSGTLPAGSGWTTGSVSASYTPSDQYVQRIILFGEAVPPNSAGDSAVLIVKVSRPTSEEDTYSSSKDHGTAAANLGILFFDLHYQKIKAGSLTQYPQ